MVLKSCRGKHCNENSKSRQKSSEEAYLFFNMPLGLEYLAIGGRKSGSTESDGDD